jgi:hypothetical protein
MYVEIFRPHLIHLVPFGARPASGMTIRYVTATRLDDRIEPYGSPKCVPPLHPR